MRTPCICRVLNIDLLLLTAEVPDKIFILLLRLMGDNIHIHWKLVFTESVSTH